MKTTITTKNFLLVFLTILFAATFAFSQNGSKAVTEYDKFDDTIVAASQAVYTPDDDLLLLITKNSGREIQKPSQVAFIFAFKEEPETFDSTYLYFLIDNVTRLRYEAVFQRKVDGRFSYLAYIPYQDLEKLAKAKKVDAKIGILDFSETINSNRKMISEFNNLFNK